MTKPETNNAEATKMWIVTTPWGVTWRRKFTSASAAWGRILYLSGVAFGKTEDEKLGYLLRAGWQVDKDGANDNMEGQ